tara:strand:+ start:87 stop:497 length:411 start_codon:yes stop_codon:yes gene_type:complete
MAILGAGNPVGGSNPAGTGGGLNVIEDRVYAYSGSINVDTDETTCLEFNTMQQLITGKFIPGSHAGESADFVWRLYLNDQVVYSIMFSGTYHDFLMFSNALEIVIPGDSRVKVTMQCTTADQDDDWTNVFTGQILQ